MRIGTLLLGAGIGWAIWSLYKQDRRLDRTIDTMQARETADRLHAEAIKAKAVALGGVSPKGAGRPEIVKAAPAEDATEAVKHALEQPHRETPVAQALAAAVEHQHG